MEKEKSDQDFFYGFFKKILEDKGFDIILSNSVYDLKKDENFNIMEIRKSKTGPFYKKLFFVFNVNGKFIEFDYSEFPISTSILRFGNSETELRFFKWFLTQKCRIKYKSVGGLKSGNGEYILGVDGYDLIFSEVNQKLKNISYNEKMNFTNAITYLSKNIDGLQFGINEDDLEFESCISFRNFKVPKIKVQLDHNDSDALFGDITNLKISNSFSNLSDVYKDFNLKSSIDGTQLIKKEKKKMKAKFEEFTVKLEDEISKFVMPADSAIKDIDIIKSKHGEWIRFICLSIIEENQKECENTNTVIVHIFKDEEIIDNVTSLSYRKSLKSGENIYHIFTQTS